MDIYERKYKTVLDLLSNIGGYFGPLNSIFSILCLILVNPNDNYRILDYLLNKNSTNAATVLKEIFDDSKEEIILENDKFKDKIRDNRYFIKLGYKFTYFFCRCFSCNKKTKHISYVDKYIQKHLTIENYLETQILTKKYVNIIKKIYELKSEYLLDNRKKENLNELNLKNENLDINNKSPKAVPLMDMNIELEDKDKENIIRESTVNVDYPISLFSEQQQIDIIKIVLKKIF